MARLADSESSSNRRRLVHVTFGYDATGVQKTMLGSIFVLSLAVLVAAGATVDPRCSRYSQGMEAQVLPYLPDCRKFVICDMGGNGQVLSCPTGLYFDGVSHACSFETDSCTHGELTGGANGDVMRPIVPHVPVQPQPLPVQPRPVPVLPQPVPVQPQPLPVQPLPVPVFPQPLPIQPQPLPVPVQPPMVIPHAPEPDMEVVELKPMVTNAIPIITAPTTAAPNSEQQQQSGVGTQQLQSVCWDQSIGKVYPILEDCGLYVVCMGNSHGIVQRCPKGLLYDAKQERCEFASAAFCATPRIDGTVREDLPSVDVSVRGADEAVQPEAPELLTYAVPVVPVEEIVRHSEVDLVHQQQPILIVPEPERVPEVAVVEYNFRVIDNHPRCLARDNLALTIELPHESDCSKYLVCVGRVAIEKQCPPGQHWSSKHSWCDFVSAAQCKQ